MADIGRPTKRREVTPQVFPMPERREEPSRPQRETEKPKREEPA